MDVRDSTALKFHVNAIIDIVLTQPDQDLIDIHNEAIDIIKSRNKKDEADLIIIREVGRRLYQYKNFLNKRKELT